MHLSKTRSDFIVQTYFCSKKRQASCSPSAAFTRKRGQQVCITKVGFLHHTDNTTAKRVTSLTNVTLQGVIWCSSLQMVLSSMPLNPQVEFIVYQVQPNRFLDCGSRRRTAPSFSTFKLMDFVYGATKKPAIFH